MPIVTRDGFRPAQAHDWQTSDTLGSGSGLAVELPGDADPLVLAGRLADIALIRIHFARFDDGRGFSLARALREQGYAGHLRAAGQLISDQLRHALQSGFDDVEIDDERAARQPEADWQVQDWPSYRRKLGLAFAG